MFTSCHSYWSSKTFLWELNTFAVKNTNHDWIVYLMYKTSFDQNIHHSSKHFKDYSFSDLLIYWSIHIIIYKLGVSMIQPNTFSICFNFDMWVITAFCPVMHIYLKISSFQYNLSQDLDLRIFLIWYHFVNHKQNPPPRMFN